MYPACNNQEEAPSAGRAPSPADDIAVNTAEGIAADGSDAPGTSAGAAGADAGASGGADASAASQVTAPAPVMSKNQMKKLAKAERYAQGKETRKAKDKEAKRQSKERRRAELEAMMAALSPDERLAKQQEFRETRKERKSSAAAQKKALANSVQQGADLVLDLDFGDKMTESEMRHLCQQVSYSYSVNRKAPRPCHLHLVGVKGTVKEMLERQITGLPNWQVTLSEATFDEHFSSKKDQLVYLTADSPHELEDLNPSHIYIIGGLVDHNRHKDLCFQRANAAGIATARLPIRNYINLDSRAVLTVNHVVHIMVEMINRPGQWKAVLDEVLPARKRAGWRQAKAAQLEAKRQRTQDADDGAHAGDAEQATGAEIVECEEQAAVGGDEEV